MSRKQVGNYSDAFKYLDSLSQCLNYGKALKIEQEDGQMLHRSSLLISVLSTTHSKPPEKIEMILGKTKLVYENKEWKRGSAF